MLYTPPIYKKNYLLIANYFDNHLYKYLKSQHCLITRKNKLQRPAQEGLRMYILERRVLAFRLKHRGSKTKISTRMSITDSCCDVFQSLSLKNSISNAYKDVRI